MVSKSNDSGVLFTTIMCRLPQRCNAVEIEMANSRSGGSYDGSRLVERVVAMEEHMV